MSACARLPWGASKSMCLCNWAFMGQILIQNTCFNDRTCLSQKPFEAGHHIWRHDLNVKLPTHGVTRVDG